MRTTLLPVLPLLVLLAACSPGGESTNQPPVAVAELRGEAVLGAVTSFQTTGTTDPDGSIASRSWNYGDGGTGTADEHVYMSAGTFQAVLTVTDNAGATASKTVPVVVARCSTAGSAASSRSPQPTVCLQTTKGELVLEVFPREAPVTTDNFLKYVDDGFYNGTLFHRTMGELIQGGGFVPPLTAKAATRPPIPLESNNGLKNWQYTVAMARSSDPNSATSQFYVNLVDNRGFDYNPAMAGPNGYAVFGQLISGTATAEAIGASQTTTVNGMANVPTTSVVIRSAVKLK